MCAYKTITYFPKQGRTDCFLSFLSTQLNNHPYLYYLCVIIKPQHENKTNAKRNRLCDNNKNMCVSQKYSLITVKARKIFDLLLLNKYWILRNAETNRFKEKTFVCMRQHCMWHFLGIICICKHEWHAI